MSLEERIESRRKLHSGYVLDTCWGTHLEEVGHQPGGHLRGYHGLPDIVAIKGKPNIVTSLDSSL